MNVTSSLPEQALCHRLVVRMPNWLGDAVMATPVLEDIKRAWPQLHVTVFAHEAIISLLKGAPHIDSYLSFSRAARRARDEKRRVLASLRTGAYDVGLLLTRSFSSAWWFWRARIPVRIGYRDHFRSLLLTCPLALPAHEEQQHQVITYKRLLAPLGIPLSDTRPQLFPTVAEKQAICATLAQHGVLPSHPLIGINPGASFGPAKRWLPERFRALTEQLLSDERVRVVYIGDSESVELVEGITQGLPSRVVNLCGKTSLRELMALLTCCRAFVTNDSGPMHLAAALNIPLVAIFGSTNEVKTGPYSDTAHVIHKHVPCSPCYHRVCPIDFPCMNGISVEEVKRKVDEIFR